MPETLDRPPAVAGEHAAWLPRHRRSAGVARLLLRRFLEGLDGAEQHLAIGELLVSELVANAVEHAVEQPRVSAGRLIGVRYEVASGVLRIEVHDAGSGRPEVSEVPAEAESGRGLWLVRELAAEWGCSPRTGGVGKCVWALIGPTRTPGEEVA